MPRADDEDVQDAWDALDVHAGIVDRASIARARALAEAVANAERVWHAAVLQRDAAVREAVTANPDAAKQRLAREVGMLPNNFATVVKRGQVAESGGPTAA